MSSINGLPGAAQLPAELLHRAPLKVMEFSRIFAEGRQTPLVRPLSRERRTILRFWHPDDRGVRCNLMIARFFRLCIFGET